MKREPSRSHAGKRRDRRESPPLRAEWKSNHDLPAGDVERRAGDPGRGGRREEQGGGSDVIRLAEPAQREAGAERRPLLEIGDRDGLALGLADVVGARDIFIGVNAVDYSGYPDCRPEFIRAFEALARLATRAGVAGEAFHIHAPLLALSKADIVRTGLRLGVDYALTSSCYAPDREGGACGRCDSCLIRAEGFRAAGVEDPTRYALP